MQDTSTEFKDQGTRSGVWIRVQDLGCGSGYVIWVGWVEPDQGRRSWIKIRIEDPGSE